MAFVISDSDMKRGILYLDSIGVSYDKTLKGDDLKKEITRVINLNNISDKEIDAQIGAVKAEVVPATPKAVPVQTAPVVPSAMPTKPTSNNAAQWKSYLGALVARGVVPACEATTVDAIKAHIDTNFSKEVTAAKADTLTPEEQKALNAPKAQ